MKMACSKSPDFRYSLASGAKYRRGFSSNFFLSSSMRAELAIDCVRLRRAAGGRSPGWGESALYISRTRGVNQKSHTHLILARVGPYVLRLVPPTILSHVLFPFRVREL